jgi:hypothetical protein
LDWITPPLSPVVAISLLCYRKLKEEETTDLMKSTLAPAAIYPPWRKKLDVLSRPQNSGLV